MTRPSQLGSAVDALAIIFLIPGCGTLLALLHDARNRVHDGLSCRYHHMEANIKPSAASHWRVSDFKAPMSVCARRGQGEKSGCAMRNRVGACRASV